MQVRLSRKGSYLQRREILIDARFSFIGSFNITEPGLTTNVKTFVRLKGRNHELLVKAYEELWAGSSDVFPSIEIMKAVEPALQMDEEDYVERLPPQEYQIPLIDELESRFSSKRRKQKGVLLTLPTGAGKTLVAAEVLRRLKPRNLELRVLWTSHRLELLRQAYATLRSQCRSLFTYFVPSDVKNPEGRNRKFDELKCAKAQHASLVLCPHRRIGEYISAMEPSNDRFDIIVIDEAHRYHTGAKKYDELEEEVRKWKARRLGLTATPLTAEKQEFGRWWDLREQVGLGETREKLQAEGFLAKVDIERSLQWPTAFRFQFRKTPRGASPERWEGELSRRVSDFEDDKVCSHVKAAYNHVNKFAKRILVFAVTIDHADKLQRKYFKSDKSVRCVHSGIPLDEIADSLKWFRDNDPECRTLISVIMLTEGVDFPKVDCLLMVRPTFSPILHQQMIGRGLRGPRLGGTATCTIVDFTYIFLDSKGRKLRDANAPAGFATDEQRIGQDIRDTR